MCCTSWDRSSWLSRLERRNDVGGLDARRPGMEADHDACDHVLSIAGPPYYSGRCDGPPLHRIGSREGESEALSEVGGWQRWPLAPAAGPASGGLRGSPISRAV